MPISMTSKRQSKRLRMCWAIDRIFDSHLALGNCHFHLDGVPYRRSANQFDAKNDTRPGQKSAFLEPEFVGRWPDVGKWPAIAVAFAVDQGIKLQRVISGLTQQIHGDN